VRVVVADVTDYSLPLRSHYVTASGTVASRQGFLLRIETETGAVGWGDAAPLGGYTVDLLAPVGRRLRSLAGNAVGGSLEALDAAAAATTATLPSAAAAVNAATLVARAVASGVSLAALLTSEEPLPAVPVSALVSAASVADVQAAGRLAASAGYQACKLKVGALPRDTDLERIRALRGVIGRGIRLRLDANGAWSRDEALQLLENVAQFDIEYIEDPVTGWADLAALGERVSVPIAVDRMLRSLDDVEAARSIAAVAVVKPSAVGGPQRALDLAHHAQRHGMRVVFGSVLESAVGLTAAVHTAAAWSDGSAVAGLATGHMFSQDVAPPPMVADGVITVPTGIGLGMTLPDARASEIAPPQFPEGGAW